MDKQAPKFIRISETKRPKTYQHIFFDLDHTLWDFEANSKNALQSIFDDNLINSDFSFQSFFSSYTKVNEACWKKYREGKMKKKVLRVKRFKDTFLKFGFEDEDLAHVFADKYLELSPYQTQLMPGTMSLLDNLKTKGYPLHIITNGFEEVQSIKMKECGLNPYFDQIIISEQLDHKKPHPSVFRHALSLAQTKAKYSLMIGDNLEADIIGAQEIGIDGVFYNPKGVSHEVDVTYEINSLTDLEKLL